MFGFTCTYVKREICHALPLYGNYKTFTKLTAIRIYMDGCNLEVRKI